MACKPDIVKQLMEEEKMGMFKSQGTNEKLEVPEKLPEELFENVPDETVGSVDNDVPGANGGISDYREVDEKLRGSEKFLQNVFDAINDGISVLDKELNIVRINQFMKDMYSESMPLVGKKCYQVYQQRESPCPWCPSLLAMESGGTQTETVPFPSDEKPEGWLNLSSYPLKDTNGNISGVIEYVRDVTKQRKSEEELQKLASVVKHSSELVNLATLDGKMIFLNETGGKILGINPDEAHKHVILDVIPEELQSKVKTEVLPSILKKGRWEGELQYKNIKTGKITDVYAQTFMIKDSLSNKSLYFANVSLDITDRKKQKEN
ncbi:MAG: PAS domain S-box protein [Bacteroidales bacterium]|nr:PAS domain S-box protein [Bacteroidales bacterium]